MRQKQINGGRRILLRLSMLSFPTVAFLAGLDAWKLRFEPSGYTWSIFLRWLLLIWLANGVLLLAWRHAVSITKPRQRVLWYEWAGLSVWCLFAAPLYQYFGLTIDSHQLGIDSIVLFWGIPVIGGMLALINYRALNIVEHARATNLPDPRALYREIERYPLNTVLRTCTLVSFWFVASSLLLEHATALPNIEVWKNISIGAAILFCLGLYQFLIVSTALGGVRSKLIERYDLQDMIRAKYYYKVFAVVMMSSLACVSLIVVVFVASTQVIARDQAKADLQQTMQQLLVNGLDLDQPSAKTTASHEKLYVVSYKDGLPFSPISLETATQFISQSSGLISDNTRRTKLILFDTIGNQKVVIVTYPSDYYNVSLGAVLILVGTACIFLMALAFFAVFAFDHTLHRAISALNESVRHARSGANEKQISILHTGDEFEGLSWALRHFVRQTNLQNQQLSEEHARLDASIDSTQLGVIMTDTAGIQQRTNSVAQKLLTSSHTTATLDIQDYALRTMHHHRPIHEASVAHGNKYIDIFAAPITTKGAKLIGAVIVLQDTTEAHVLQRSKDEFFSIASHELRTPLTAIRGNASMIKTLYPEVLASNADLETMIEDMHQSSVRLIGIVNDFLDVSRLEQGKAQFRPSVFVIQKTIDAVAYDLRQALHDKQLELTVDKYSLAALKPVWADEDRVKQVIYNLLGNAAKFTTKGGITITGSNQGTKIKIAVTDTGPGIAPEDQNLLFRKFQQAGKSLLTRDAARGTGLGLYISKHLVEAMGGTVGLEHSEPGVGTTFSFTLPIATPDKQAKP